MTTRKRSWQFQHQQRNREKQMDMNVVVALLQAKFAENFVLIVQLVVTVVLVVAFFRVVVKFFKNEVLDDGGTVYRRPGDSAKNYKDH